MVTLLQNIQNTVRQTPFSLTTHGQQQITTRRIRVRDLRETLLSPHAEVIENYPEDSRGSSCLIYSKAGNRPLHVHLSYPPEIIIITAYESDPDRWTEDLKRRKEAR